MPLLLDFESRSRCDLKKHGGRLYWEHPSTKALCAVLHDTDTGESELWLPGDPTPDLSRGTLAAHNATGFDRFAAHRVWGVPLDYPWIDTESLARYTGLPGALDALGTRWLGIPKDKAASAFTKGLSRPSRARARRGQLPDLTPEVLERVVRYCASDVEILVHGWPLLEPWADLEPDVARVDRAINDRGVRVDVQLMQALLRADEHNAETELAEIARRLGHLHTDELRAIVGSPAQFCAATGLDNAQAATIDAVIAANPNHRAADFCRARRAIASITAGKLRAGLARVSPDGRLRDSHKYYGAHTGRWSSKGMQHQNFPRPDKSFESWGDDEICRLADRVLAGKHTPNQAEIDLLLRACFIPSPGHVIIVSDFSGVEARALAWAAGDEQALAIYRGGKLDTYKVAAAQIYGVPYDAVTKDQRQAGKVAELACGYGGGEGALLSMAAGMGIDLTAASVTPEEIVGAWRELHAPVKAFWYELEGAFKAAALGNSGSQVSCFTVTPSDDGRDVAIFLPSGRPIVYNETRVHREQAVSRAGKSYTRTSASFLGNKSGREYTYGGKLTENVIQAMCRCLMAEALVKAEDTGLCPVLHVHDEAVCEVPASARKEGLAVLNEIMLDLPEWAEGFPIGAAGHTGRRYRK